MRRHRFAPMFSPCSVGGETERVPQEPENNAPSRLPRTLGLGGRELTYARRALPTRLLHASLSLDLPSLRFIAPPPPLYIYPRPRRLLCSQFLGISRIFTQISSNGGGFPRTLGLSPLLLLLLLLLRALPVRLPPPLALLFLSRSAALEP